MKFIHAADLHLDSRSSKIKKLYGQKEISIIEASQRAFVSLIDSALQEKVDFMVLSGDLFDANWRDYSVGLFFIEQIKRLECSIYSIRGNHDSENRLLKNLPFPKNFITFDSNEPQTIFNEDLKVAIHGQSYAKYHIKDDLALNYPKALPGYFNVGLLHTSGEKQNGELPYAPYDKRELLKKKYDYWALGHMHSPQIISRDPYIVYSGTIQGRHAKEIGPKGCYLVNVEGHEITSINFKRLGNVQWETITLNISKVDSEKLFKETLISEVKQKLKNERRELVFVIRLVLEGLSLIEKKFHSNKEYYRNAIYCWLADALEDPIYIEKIIDRTHDRSYSSAKKEPDQIWHFILEELGKEDVQEEVKKLVEEEKSTILQKIPTNVLEEIQDEEIESKNEDSFTLVRQYIESKTSELADENTSS